MITKVSIYLRTPCHILFLLRYIHESFLRFWLNANNSECFCLPTMSWKSAVAEILFKVTKNYWKADHKSWKIFRQTVFFLYHAFSSRFGQPCRIFFNHHSDSFHLGLWLLTDFDMQCPHPTPLPRGEGMPAISFLKKNTQGRNIARVPSPRGRGKEWGL